MKETLLLYNITDKKIRSTLQLLSVKMKFRLRVVAPSQYKMPLGLLAFGSPADQEEYLVDEPAAFDDSMLFFAGFSSGRLNQVLAQMAKNKTPKVNLKAAMTEHNAVWDSIQLHKELSEEHAALNPNT